MIFDIKSNRETRAREHLPARSHIIQRGDSIVATSKKAPAKKKAAAKKAAPAAKKKAAAKTPAAKKAPSSKKPAAKKQAAQKPAPARVNEKVAVVTGACGFAGSHMTDLLVEKGYHVIATDLDGADRKFVNPSAEFIPADITSPESLRPLFAKKPALVFHPAAVFDYEAPWDLCERVNVGGMKNICEASLDAGVKRLLLFSTVSVYGYPKPEELPVREDNAKRPGTNYERSKWMQEETAVEYASRGLPTSIVRPAPLYGPRNVYGMATILFLMAKFPILPFPVNLDNRMVGVNVRDVCRAALFLVDKKKAIGEAYNVIDNSSYTMREFAEHVCPLLGVKILPIFIPRELFFLFGNQVADISRSVGKIFHTRPFVEKDMVYYLKAIYSFSNDKLRSLGFEFEYPDLLEGLTETIQWYRENHYLDRRELWTKVFERV
jgi:nucleoside-diphosphate-sugar epimerase